MIKQIRQQLIADIKDTLGFGTVDKYRGEFEEGSDWSPSHSACFLRVMNYRSRVRAADGKGLRKSVVIKIYAGSNSRHGKDALDMIENLINMLDGSTLEGEHLDDNRYNMTVSEEGMDMILYERGFEGYTFNLIVT
jgi:hypothetical protein